MSKVGVAGAGYVGLTTGACLADLGNDVCIVDVDQEKVRRLRAHKIPFFEPGLQEIVERNARAGRLKFTDSYEEAVPGAEFFFIAVSTPEGDGGQADIGQVEAAAASIARSMQGALVIVNKSTVPIGTGDMVSKTVRRHNPKAEVEVVANPEFLREGSAVLDFMRPDRVVIGAQKRAVAEKVAELYKPVDAHILITDIYTAEMIKYASNAFLATRISFMNEVARIAERVDADIKVVAEGMGLDRRIGPLFLDAGIGFGGSCFPKDVKELAAIAELYDYHPELLTAVMEINQDMRGLATEKLRECLGTLRNQVVGLLGLAFKPNTDDLREAPSIDIAKLLNRKGAIVRVYDPAAMEAARALLPEVEFHKSAYSIAKGADALLLVTEWNEFKQLDMGRIKRVMRRPVLVDGR